MTIAEEAVRAAAWEIFRYDAGLGMSNSYAPTEHHKEEARLALDAAAQFLIAQAAARVRANNDHIEPGSGAYSSGFHYALDCLHLEETD